MRRLLPFALLVVAMTGRPAHALNTLEDACRQPAPPPFCATFLDLTPAQREASLRDIRPRQQRQLGRDLGMAARGAGRAIGQRLQGLRLQQGRMVMPDMDVPVRGGSSGGELLDAPWGGFAMGLQARSEQSADADQVSYDNDRTQWTVGVDRRVTDSSVVGVAVSQGESDATLDGGRSDQTGTADVLTLFASHYLTDQVYVDGYLMTGQATYDTDRAVELGANSPVISSSTDARAVGAGLSMGLDLQWNAWGGGVYGRLDRVDQKIDGYEEAGPNGLGLSVDSQQSDSVLTTAGVRLSRTVSSSLGVFVPQLNIERIHDSDNGVRVLTGNVSGVSNVMPVTYESPSQDTSYGSISLSLAALLPGGVSGFARYDTLQWRDDGYDSQIAEVGARIEF